MTTINLRRAINREEFDYSWLVSRLSHYSNPRVKINAMLKKGDIIRVKKGIYIFGEQYRLRPYSRELLANWIYGPSIVSLDYMLSYYGLIPEQVYAMTSTTPKRSRNFNTPVGAFIYRQVPLKYNRIGMTRIEWSTGSFLAASPERALADKIRDDQFNILRSLADAKRYLFEDLRIDEEIFMNMDAGLLKELAIAAQSKKIRICADLLLKYQTK